MDLEVGPRIIIRFSNGVYITESVLWGIIVGIALIIFAFVSTRKLQRDPKGLQAYAELIVETVYNFVKTNMGARNLGFAPYIGTLFLWLLVCNALGLLGWRAPTADMNFTFAMGILVFFLIQISSIKAKGTAGYLRHFAEPYVFMVPIKIMEEFTFPVSLSFRIFGNILAGVIVMELIMHLLSYLSIGVIGLPVPLLQIGIPLPLNAFFDMFEPVLQAFVFCMLTMAFIAKANVTEH
jgi:F-type H+-transporting ATPase subunit a